MQSKKNRDQIFLLGVLFFALFLITGVGGYFYVYDQFFFKTIVKDFYANIASGFGSIAITIIIVDRIVKRQQKKEIEGETKHKLLSDLHSPVNTIAKNAAHELRSLGKLTGDNAWTVFAKLGGNADLTEARLYDANFFGAKLIGANFFKADLRNSNFCDCDLTGCNLTKANMSGARFNENTILPDGNAWSRQINLALYEAITDSSDAEKNWLDRIDLVDNNRSVNQLALLNVTAKNLIIYLKKKYPKIPLAENELHFYRHWNALVEYGYLTIQDVDDLIERTREARNWIWKRKLPEYSIFYISFSVALENPQHLNLPHWNEATKGEILATRIKFYDL